MNRHPIRLLALDIDGTLTDLNFQVPARNIAALRAAHDAGIEIMLATGRRHDYALPIAQELGFPLWLISSNGALIRSSAGETFFTDRLPARTASELIQYMDEFRGHAVLTFDRAANVPGNDSLVLESADELNKTVSRWLEVNRPYIKFVSPLEDSLTEDPLQAMYCGRVAFMEGLRERLRQAEFLEKITVLKTQYDHRDLCILDILNRECSKGHALRRWAEQRGIPREQVMAIGDNHNDLEMLEFAGVAVVMENASHELKQNGWRVTGSNEENGVAQAMEEILGLAFSG
ncbi:MAG TPA: Cof-type HAD-IIB family hydrolase [Candidatus Polarisedimenticolia bacterium]|nr:Cof-type HAD-IIB family hydrolase [Candidatus Polarisedimenticolia bacterium]